MAYTDYLASLQQQRQPGGLDNGSAAAGMLMQALQRKQVWDQQQAEKQRLAAERERALKAEERKQNEAKLKATEEYVGRMAQAGLGESAAAAYKQAQGLRTELYGLAGPDIVGGIDPSGAYDVQTHQPLRNMNDKQTLGMLQNLSGVKPDVGVLAPGNMAYNKATGAEIASAPYAPKVVGGPRTGYYTIDPNGGGASMPAGGAPMPAARPGMIVPPAPVQPRSSGGGSRGGGRRSGGGGTVPSVAPPGIVPGTQGSRGGGMRLSDPRTQATIDEAAAKARKAALEKQPSRTSKIRGTMYDDPIAAQYAADKAEYAVRKKWGQNVKPPQPPAPYTHPKPAKVSAAADAILQRYGLLEGEA